MKLARSALLSLALLLLAVHGAATTASISSTWLLEEIRTLTAPEMDGRGSGTAGAERAARHIVEVLRGAGLAPGNGPEYLHAFPLAPRPEIGVGTRLVLGDRALTLGTDWMPLGASGDGAVEGSIAFVGYGISAPEIGYDDYAGLDVRGRVVLAMSGEPRRGDPVSPFAGASLPPHGFHLHKAEVAAAHGARALLLVARPDGREDALPALAGAGIRTSIPVAAIKRGDAQKLLASGAGASAGLDAVMRAIDTALAPASRALPDGARLEIRIERGAPRGASNIVAVLPGTDPLRAHEAVVIGAHYDHLGRHGVGQAAGHGGSEASGGEIYPGADDNASGTAAVLAMARHFAAAGGTPRTLVFALFAGEELGLLGSGAYVVRPPFPLERTVAMVNLDMVGRMRNDRVHVSGIDSARGLREIVAAAGEGLGLDVALRGDPFGPSDHQSFYRHGVPVLFFNTGGHEDYHRPSDTWEKINAPGLERIATLAARVADRLAREPAPAYARVVAPAPLPRGGSGAFLGISHDGTADWPGVRLAMVVPDSPADRAGVRPGDLIVRFAGVRVYGLEDLRELLAARRAGDRVEVVYRRDGGEHAVETTLVGRQ